MNFWLREAQGFELMFQNCNQIETAVSRFKKMA
jgi:hypothetical protein